MASDEIGTLLKNKKTKDFQSLARLLTLLEKKGPQALRYKELLNPKQYAFRIGITGPPGAGKSTLIAQMIKEFREKGLTVAVLAIDPSSPFTQGAILGDRIRYSESFNDEGVFIRSIGSRGSSGGLTASAYLMLRAFDMWGFDVVLIETVGVGQTELEIMYVADYVVVTLVPESGDAIQAMKAGLLEIANVFVVNKSDRPGSESYARELKDTLESSGDADQINVMLTTATQNQGVEALVSKCLENKSTLKIKNIREQVKRLQAEARALIQWRDAVKNESKFKKIKSLADLRKLF